jgi:glycosyltransferase involved in cell wall biosynthesis
MDKKLVSVIVPAYNAGRYLGKALTSLISQTYRELEILVVDDGSSDNTYDVAREFAERDSRIKVNRIRNGGVSNARNTALDMAAGEYLFFLDSDDTAEPFAVEKMTEAMESSGAELICSNYSRWDESGKRLEDYDLMTGFVKTGTDEERFAFAVNELLPYKVGYEVWGKLYRTKLVKETGIRFDTDCRIGEDLAFNLKYITKASGIMGIPDRCIRYLVRESSAMGNTRELSKKISEDGLLLKGFWDYILANGNAVFTDSFPVILVRTLDAAYIGHTPLEAAEAYDEIAQTKAYAYIRAFYKGLDSQKEEIISMYPEEIAGIKYKYHLYVRSRLRAGKILDRCLLFVYNVYRIIRRRELLAKWKMPY